MDLVFWRSLLKPNAAKHLKDDYPCVDEINLNLNLNSLFHLGHALAHLLKPIAAEHLKDRDDYPMDEINMNLNQNSLFHLGHALAPGEPDVGDDEAVGDPEGGGACQGDHQRRHLQGRTQPPADVPVHGEELVTALQVHDSQRGGRGKQEREGEGGLLHVELAGQGCQVGDEASGAQL